MFDVVIIGAGLSGLSCAQTLKKELSNLEILVVEARSVVGGRVCPCRTFCNSQPIELGAELVHGTRTILNDYLKEIRSNTIPVYTWAQGDGGPHPDHKVRGGGGYYYLGAESLLLSQDSDDPDFIHLNSVLQKMTEGSSYEQSMLDYLHDNKVSPRMIPLAEAGYANTLCSTLSSLPRYQTAQVMGGFDGDGDAELLCVDGHEPLLQHLCKNIKIRTDWAVKQIIWRQDHVRLISEQEEEIIAKKVVCTPSVAIMKHLTFCPRLSRRHEQIYQSIRMEPCMKISLKFHTQFYPSDFHGMICSDCPVPEFWTVTFKQPSPEYILMAFASAEFARNLSQLSTTELRITILSQLDRIFGNQDTKPATDSYMDMIVQDWTKERYIQGGYSSPSFFVTSQDRQYIASSIQNTLIFAGEHTCETRYMVMHSAIESGIRAAKEIISLSTNNKEPSNSV